MSAVEFDNFGSRVGAIDGLPNVFTQGGHPKHSATRGNYLVVFFRSTGMKDNHGVHTDDTGQPSRVNALASWQAHERTTVCPISF